MSGVDDLLGAWLSEELAREPTQATSLGVEGLDGQLGDFGAARWQARPHADRRWAGAIGALHLGALPLDERVDLVLVLSHLAGRQVMDDWEAWRRDPSIYVGPCLSGIFSLWLHRLHPEPELVASTVSRLEQIPGVLDAAKANLVSDLTPPVFAARAAGAARAGVRYLAELLPAEASDPALRAELGAAAARPAEALRSFAGWVAELQERARGDWAIGEDRYSALLADRELLGISAADLHGRGVAAYEELAAEMTELAASIDPSASGWPEVLAALDADCPDSPETMRAAYERSCDEARSFLVERALVTLPEGERCLVVPSPVFQRPMLAVASYQDPPPFSSSRTGHFFVPFPPDGESPEGVAERLAGNGYHAIPTTAVHEAYPGHHWQLTWAGATPRPVRKALTTSYFVEGWALYAERMMREQGFFHDPRAVLSHLGARIFRAARIIVDTALHTGAMSADEAVTFLEQKVVMTPAVARAEVDRYCSWPTQAASYLTGSMQIEALRARWMADSRGSLRQFHDAVAANPGLPVALVEQLLFPPA